MTNDDDDDDDDDLGFKAPQQESCVAPTMTNNHNDE